MLFALFSQSLQLNFNDVCLLFVFVIAADSIGLTDVFALPRAVAAQIFLIIIIHVKLYWLSPSKAYLCGQTVAMINGSKVHSICRFRSNKPSTCFFLPCPSLGREK